MAPALIETPASNAAAEITYSKDKRQGNYKEAFQQTSNTTNYDTEINGSDTVAPAKYINYLPYWDDTKYPAYEPFSAYDHGNDADPAFPNLVKEGVEVRQLTANIGAEVSGVQLSKLGSTGQDELALFVAQHKVVAFRNQDFADLPIKDALEFAEYYGPSHIHQTSGAPKGFPKVHLVHRSAADTTAKDFFEERTNSITWHSDVTFELQPPGTTFLYLLEGPPAGGDTLFANMAVAYQCLSPRFRKRLHGLEALHSGHEQVQASLARGSIARREPISTIHPIVRTHPVTGEKALFVNAQFTKRIVGYKKDESDFLLKFLFDHVALSADIHVRVKWAPGTVVVYDNRNTCHSAILDWQDGQRRHLARLTPRAERPYETPFEEEQ